MEICQTKIYNNMMFSSFFNKKGKRLIKYLSGISSDLSFSATAMANDARLAPCFVYFLHKDSIFFA